MRVLVTGATGFVGQYLTTDLSSGKDAIFGTFLNRDFPSRINANLFACDMRDREQVRTLVKDVRPDHTYHLAALSSVLNSFDDAKAVYEANFFGALNLLNAIREFQPKSRVLLVGSAHAYGRVSSTRAIQEGQALQPDTPYGVSKAAADLLGGQFFQSYGLNVIRARPFNHTGPGQSTHFVCSDFAKQFAAIDLNLRDARVQVGNCAIRRDFSDVRDVVRAYRLLMRRGRQGEAYNVSSGRATSIRDILKTLSSFCSRKVKIEVITERIRPGEPETMFGSNRKIRKDTGWRPVCKLRDTLEDLYLYWRTALEAEEHQQA